MALATRPLTVGAEVIGVDATLPISDAVREELYGLFIQHGMLLFRGAGASAEAHTRLAECFGELERHFRATPALGEIVIVVAGASQQPDAGDAAIDVHDALDVLREAGLGLKQASAVVARLTGKGRREVYQDALKSREDDDSADD